MATLTSDELQLIRRELADNVVDLGAVPYIGHRQIYDVLRDNVSSSAVAATSSSTAVASPGATVLTLATTAGLAVGDKVVVDCDAQRETVTVRAVTGVVGGTISVICRRTHGGTYPVEKASALTLVRGALADLAVLQDRLDDAASSAGIKRVDEVEFVTSSEGRSQLDELRRHQHALRIELARMLGLGGLLERNARRGGSVEIY